MLALVWLLVKILFDFLRAVRRLPPGPSDARFLLHGGVAIIIVTALTGLFELNLGDSEVLTLFLAAVACVYVAWDTASAELIGAWKGKPEIKGDILSTGVRWKAQP